MREWLVLLTMAFAVHAARELPVPAVWRGSGRVSRPYDLAILGGGTAGLVAAVGAARVGARAILFEPDRTGGDCLWSGCVPSKSLLAVAALAQDARTADRVGLEPLESVID
ncbi:MAG: FAD-dependent oxidoreductase, partial [Thermoleophilaceae bacterium]